jgi:hypothetical protein
MHHRTVRVERKYHPRTGRSGEQYLCLFSPSLSSHGSAVRLPFLTLAHVWLSQHTSTSSHLCTDRMGNLYLCSPSQRSGGTEVPLPNLTTAPLKWDTVRPDYFYLLLTLAQLGWDQGTYTVLARVKVLLPCVTWLAYLYLFSPCTGNLSRSLCRKV